MKHILFSILLWTATLSASPLSLLLESDDITAIDEYVHSKSIVVFDLDDTLIRCQTSLGSSPWFYGKLLQAVEEGVPFQEACDYLTEINKPILKHLTFELIDEEARNLIKKYQDQGIVVVALTARPSQLIDYTIAALEEIQIDFSKSLHVDGPFIFDFYETFGYQKGVLFVSDYHTKEEVLEAFIDQLPRCYEFNRIIFVDDKMKYLKPTAEFSQRRGIEFVGLRYSHEDARKEIVDLDIADKQLAQLHCHLPEHILDQASWIPWMTPIDKPLVPEFTSSGQRGWVLFGRVVPDEHFVETK